MMHNDRVINDVLSFSGNDEQKQRRTSCKFVSLPDGSVWVQTTMSALDL